MKDLYHLFIELRNIIGVGAVVVAFLLIALGQSLHEKGSKLGRPIQYIVGALYLAFIFYLLVHE